MAYGLLFLLAAKLESEFGFRPELMVLDGEQVGAALQNNPYREGEGKFVHLYFSNNVFAFNGDNIERYRVASEAFVVRDKVFYLSAPEGIGRSKLVANIEA